MAVELVSIDSNETGVVIVYFIPTLFALFYFPLVDVVVACIAGSALIFYIP